MNKAIASLAIIKVNWDAQKTDYIQNFVPFIVTLIHKKRYSIIEINTVKTDFEEEFGLVIPYHPLITVLERARRQGYIQKNQHGKYVPIAKQILEDDFSEVALEQEQKYSNVLKKFIEFCEEKGEVIHEEQADAIIVSFFREHDLDILFASFGDDKTVFPSLKAEHENNAYIKSYLINSFFINSYERDPETFGFLVDLSVGHLMANTLLYNQDYQKFQGRFNGNYYLDTGLLFNIVGINGLDRKLAYEEFIKLLKENGAQVFVFRHTYEEFIGILETCMNWVESPSIDPSKSSRALLFFVDNGFTCSDVERFILNVSDVLDSLKITIVLVPDPNVDMIYQIDEKMLEEMIIDKYKENAPYFDKEEKDYTIRQDIKSLAAIFKLRRGEKPLTISDVKHLFVTSNTTLAYISRKFEIFHSSDDNFFFIPTSLTDVFIGTLVWVNSPAKVLEISQKRLIANCYAALQPSRVLLKKYVSEIEKLREQGEIGEDEAIVLRVSRAARNLLTDETMGDPDRFTDKTAIEILEEIRERIRKDEEEKLSTERAKIQVEAERLREKEEALEAESQRSEVKFINELSRKDQDLIKVTQERDQYEMRIDQISNTIATWISRSVYLISICLVIFLAIFEIWPDMLPVIPAVKIFVTIAAVLLGAISLITGFNFRGARDGLRQSIRVKVQRFFKTVLKELSMNKVYRSWHEVIILRPDLKSGELSLSSFAADLYDVQMQKGRRPIYEDPAQFFALTYPTYNLRELAKDVVLRLAGKNEKAVRQLELTYGGGKTHTLITLYHLVNLTPGPSPLRGEGSQRGEVLTLPAVQEFIQHIGITPPQARVAALTFDKLDVEKGMEVRAPNGETRWLKQPWSVLAFQIAGADGLRLLHAEGLDAERESAPAENLLAELLALPGKQGLATLVLIDEVLMYAREKIGFDPAWRGRLVNFFQYLTQAVTRVDRAALVASLLATDPRKSDTLGKEITQELYAIFRREREEGVQPVVKEDVAEVLRRRFFTPESIRDREAFRPHVVAALKGIVDLDEQTRKEGKAAEERYLKSYPFHPDLTDIFYTKWTNLEGFQRTRGVLRTFALALRDAESWDQSPLVGANVFLGKPARAEIGEAARELTSIAATEEYEGRRQEWTAILEGELEKAQEIQRQFSGVGNREVEQGVMATFLHSQPIGQKALTRELFLLVGHTRPDKIELEKALRRWADMSWFLDEAATQEADTAPDGTKSLPKSWRLGSRPNLRQMHHDACLYHVPPELVSAKLLEEIQKLKSLTAGASAAGARPHNLPDKPSDIEDDGEFHYAVLGPKAACDPGKPSQEARRFLEETTGVDRPRVYRNAVLLAVPSKDGLEMARGRIIDYLGWEEVRSQLKTQELDPLREQMLAANLEGSRKGIPEAIRQAYSIVVTVSEKNEIQAFKVTIGSDPLFKTIKDNPLARIQDTAVSAEALLPGGPYDLWREGETARRLKDLEGAFAQFPHLPKMLNRKAIHDTLVDGCIEGILVLRLVRPDRTFRTFWRQRPDDIALKEPALEVVLPENAVLSELPSNLLIPNVLPALWDKSLIPLKVLLEYFVGGRVVSIQKEGYSEPQAIPKAGREAITAAVSEAVKEGRLWLTSGPASIWAEEIPAGLLTDDAVLQAPPPVISSIEVLPASLPDAWQGDSTTALAISAALSKKAGQTLPWRRVRDAIDGAIRARYLETTLDSGTWPCEFPGAQTVKLRVAVSSPPSPPLPPPPKRGIFMAEADLRPNEIQDLADVVGDLSAAAVGNDLRFHLRIELGGEVPPSIDVVEGMNKKLADVTDKLKLQSS